METGTYEIPYVKRGNTFLARNIATFTLDDDPVVVTRALMQIRDGKTDEVIYEWSTEGEAPNASITGSDNTVTINDVEPSVTRGWPPGGHIYDLEVDFANYGTQTPIGGPIIISADVSRPTT